jgi:hypothetical protein
MQLIEDKPMRILKRPVLAAAFCTACIFPAKAQGLGFASFSALIDADGTTTRGLGVQASSNTAAGRYTIEFTRPVNRCAYVASPYGNAAGQVSVTPVAGQTRKIGVRTFNKVGAAANSAFMVLVSCPAVSGPAL